MVVAGVEVEKWGVVGEKTVLWWGRGRGGGGWERKAGGRD